MGNESSIENLVKQEVSEGRINPEITKNFIADISAKAERGVYRVEVMIGDKIMPIDVYPGVFPPRRLLKGDKSTSKRCNGQAI